MASFDSKTHKTLLVAFFVCFSCSKNEKIAVGIDAYDDRFFVPDFVVDVMFEGREIDSSSQDTAIEEETNQDMFENALDIQTDEETCVPQCEGLECGPDGCGGICGFCPYGMFCKGGVCIEYCVPDCTGKECGDDGCNGECGTCDENEYCAPNFTCVLKGCQPKCSERECGPDGCGGFCGSCPDGYVCDPQKFVCIVDTSCHDVTATGRCVGNELQWCENGVLKKKDCTLEGLLCGYSDLAKKYMCLKPEQCTPQCAGKECGPDGCNGVCGQCGEGLVCSDYGNCGEPCGTITESGTCQGEVLVYCHGGILIKYDCRAHGLHCVFDPTMYSGKGGYNCLLGSSS